MCGFSAGPQNNWLITQLINRTVNGTRLPHVSVTIEFELRDCDDKLNCQRTFNTHIYETSSENSAGRKSVANYQQVRRILPDNTNGSRTNETIIVTFNTNHSSFFFAIQDQTTCVVITRLMIFYHICPKEIVDLIFHPETIAPVLGKFIVVSPSCAMNAEPVSGLAPQRLVCITGGVWSRVPSGARCRCVDGYFHANEICRCKYSIHNMFA